MAQPVRRRTRRCEGGRTCEGGEGDWRRGRGAVAPPLGPAAIGYENIDTPPPRPLCLLTLGTGPKARNPSFKGENPTFWARSSQLKC